MTVENQRGSEHDRPKTESGNGDNDSQLAKITASYRTGWVYAEIAIQYGLSIVICALIGWWVDNRYGGGNTWMMVGVVFGTVFGFIGMMKSLLYKQKKKK